MRCKLVAVLVGLVLGVLVGTHAYGPRIRENDLRRAPKLTFVAVHAPGRGVEWDGLNHLTRLARQYTRAEDVAVVVTQATWSFGDSWDVRELMLYRDAHRTGPRDPGRVYVLEVGGHCRESSTTVGLAFDYDAFAHFSDAWRPTRGKAVYTHEFGHLLGLDHCPRPDCAMLSWPIEDDYCGNCRRRLR